MGETFRRAGYRTFGTGKWHNGEASYHRSFTDGAEIFFGGMADHWNVPAYDFDPSGRYDATLPMTSDPRNSNEVTQRRGDHVHAGRHSTDIISDAAVRFIDGYADEAPFFAYVAFLAPHDPRTMPKRYLDMYDPATLPLPGNFMGGHPFDNGDLHVRDEMLCGFPRTPEDVRRHIAEYYAMISHLDDRIGEVVETVKRKGLFENTIFVLAGDNGLALGRHGLFGKQNRLRASVRVPLVFAGPGIPEGARSDALVYLLDIFPTLCDFCEVETPKDVDGMSLAGAIRRPGEPVREDLYLAFTDKHRGVRTDRWKLIEYVVNARHTVTQLFDLAADPLELHNLADAPNAAATLADMRARLVRLRGEWDDMESEWGQRFWSGISDSWAR